MKTVEFENGMVQIDAAIVAEGLGLAPSLLQQDARRPDHERCRARGRRRPRTASPVLFSKHRRFRVVVDETGAILQRSAVDFGDSVLPKSAHKSG